MLDGGFLGNDTDAETVICEPSVVAFPNRV